MESPRLDVFSKRRCFYSFFKSISKLHFFPLTSYFLCITTFSLIILVLACSPTEAVFKDHELTITVDAEVTETWITLEVGGLEKNSNYIVKRDSIIIYNNKLDKRDTLLHDGNLEPSTSYSYTVYAQKGSQKSDEVVAIATTMDTTSHNFTIEKFEWGAHSSSQFMDAFIIAANDIWAVGEIHTEETDRWNEDSTKWVKPFNAVHWDGEEWKLKRIPFSMCDNQGTSIYPRIEGVYFFDADNAVFAASGFLTIKDGAIFIKECSMNAQLKGGMRHIWGTNKSNYYIVGGKGTILHFANENWRFINTHTEIDINDIYGTIDNLTNTPYLLMPLSFKWDIGDKKLFQLKSDNSLLEQDWPFPDRRLNSVFFMDKERIFVCGAGVFTRNRFNKWKEYKDIPFIFTDRIRGNNINDIFIAGDFGILAHYNGKTWKEYTEFNEISIFRGLAVKDDLTIAVGEKNSKAVIYMIRRY